MTQNASRLYNELIKFGSQYSLLKSLKKKASQWWYFIDDPHVPSDNNRAERNLRLAVTKRKVCGDSRSMDGLHNTATLLTVI